MLFEAFDKQNLEKDIVFVGIYVHDSTEEKSLKGAIFTCQQVIIVIMITGDHPETAKAIAFQVGINSVNVLTGIENSKMSD